jgi:hypothetical protein
LRTGAYHRRLKAVAPFLVAGTFAIAANATSGLEPSQQGSIPDSAFRPVTVAAPAPSPSVAPTPGRTPDLSEIREPFTPTPPPDRARPSTKTAKPIVVVVPTPQPNKPASAGATTAGHSISGYASWYCRAGQSPCTFGHSDGPGVDAYAAAGPRLRAAIGASWRGRIVTVDGIRVELIDWCQCFKGESNEKLLDLYYDVYARTGSKVVVRW